MILKNYLTTVFVFVGLSALCQSKVCSSQSNDITDLNTIGKCAIENFKKSNEKEFVVVSTRSRFVRKRNNQYLTKLKDNVNTVAKTSKPSVVKKMTLDNVEMLPLFSGCSTFSGARKCFDDQIDHYITENFKYPEEAFKRGVEDRVLTSFTIDVNGNVTNVIASSSKSDISLEKEAKRIISTLPKLVPARQNGIATSVDHKVYINFDIHGGNETSAGIKSVASNEGVIADFVRFDEVSEKPVFVTCADYQNDIQQECIKETILQDILDHLIYPFDAAADGIEGRVWVRFIVDEDGYVKNITTAGPQHGELLEKEAERLVKLLPKFLPGKHNNQYVNVEYFIPFDFHLDE